jgi:glycosyltransferase involved in cell wall biosynthesis
VKIAVWHNLPSGGGKRALYCHVRGLVERGHTVEAWCPSTADQDYLPLSDLINMHVFPFSWKQRRFNGQISRALTTYHNVIKNIEAMDQHCRQCAEEINRGGFDLLFANSCMFFSVSPIGRHVTIPKVIYLQEPHRRLYEAVPKLLWIAPLPPKSFWWSPRYLRMFLSNLIEVQGSRVQAREELWNAQVFDTILVNSLFSRESVLRAYGLDAKVCYLGVDTVKFSNLHQQRENFVVGVGSITPLKGIRFVIEAIGRVREPRPRLVWIGNFASRSYLEELSQLAQSVNVGFEPKVGIGDDELVNTLNRASMMVYAPRLEPFGLAPLEANACGLPVIAVAEGGVRETLIDGINGLFVEPDVNAMAKAIAYLRSEKDYARKLAENGNRLVAKKWSLRAAVEQLERILMDVIGTVAKQDRGA